MAIRIYQYPKCSTCRKALKWLDERKIAYDAKDIVAKPPSTNVLRDLFQRSGLPVTKLFNTSGESYRKGNFKEKLANMSDAEAISALSKDGKLIKRPIVDTGKDVLIGFDDKAYTAKLK